jgi:hypothetical protein
MRGSLAINVNQLREQEVGKEGKADEEGGIASV